MPNMPPGYGVLVLNGQPAHCTFCGCTTGVIDDDGNIACIHCSRVLRQGYYRMTHDRYTRWLVQNRNSGYERDSDN